MKNLKTLKKFTFALIFAMAGLVGTPSFADEFDEFDDSSTISAPAADTTYDGSTDSEFAHDEEYADAYARYKKEQTSRTEINRQRTEGFSRAIQLAARISGGINTFFGAESEGWSIGFLFGGGLSLQMPLGIENLSMVPELTFNYRHYSFEASTQFGYDDAEINIMLFEIPLIVRYTFEDYNFYTGLGVNLALKLMGNSEYNQNFDGGAPVTDNNALVTSSVEVGGVVDVGYMLMRNIHINIRVVQSFTNLLNKALVPPGRFEDASLLTFYTSVGVSFLF